MKTDNIETKSASWFEVTAKYDKIEEDGGIKRVTETFTVNAVTFGESEERMTQELTELTSAVKNISSEAPEIKAIKKAPYKEIFFSNKSEEEWWYKVVVAFITIDEKTEKEKKAKVTYLVQANSTSNAEKNVREVFDRSMQDYVISSVSESNIVDVIDYE